MANTKLNAAQKRELEAAARMELSVQNYLDKTERLRAMPVVNSRADAWKLASMQALRTVDETAAYTLADAINSVEDLTKELERAAESAERMVRDVRRMLETRRIDSSRPAQSYVADINVTHQRLVDAIKFGRTVAHMCNVHVPMFHDTWETEQRELRLSLSVIEWGAGFAISKRSADGIGAELVTKWQDNPVGDDNARFATRIAAVKAMAEICGSRL
jgi:hypothetical protein